MQSVQQIRYEITGGLSQKQMDEIHNAALRILDTIGLAISTPEATNDELLAALSTSKGVFVRQGRICFRHELVDGLLAEHRKETKRVLAVQPAALTIGAGVHAFNIYDSHIGKTRPCNTEDCVRYTKLANTYYDEGVRCGLPGFPSDAPRGAQGLAAYKIACEYSRSGGNGVANAPEEREAMYEMARVMGPATEGYGVGMHPVSPLRLEGNEFDGAIRMWKKIGDKLSVSCGPMPIMGVSAPIHFPAALAQGIAESIGSFVFFKLLTGKASFWINFYAFDMKYGVFAYGGPEDSIIALIRRQMNDYYGLSQGFGDKALSTMSHAVDAHAAGEKAAKTVIALMAGTNVLATAGSLSLDETLAPEQLVLDMEIVHWAKHLAQGFAYDASMLEPARIEEGINNAGDFLSLDRTLESFRDTYWMPDLFDHMMLSQWQSRGGKSLTDRAREIADKRLATDNYGVNDDQRREIDRIYTSFIQKIT